MGSSTWIPAMLAIAGLALFDPVRSAGAAEAARIRPHIVIILADDMGFSDIGCYGSEIETPNLDRLAAGGMRFAQFYNCARCCPTRAALLTGVYPHQAGIGHMVADRGIPSYRGHLSDRCVTIAEALRAGGYRTYMAGKWHVGEERPHWPLDRGFERFYGIISGASSYFETSPGRTMARDNEPFVAKADSFYLTDAISENAAAFIREHGGDPSPFFLYVAYTAPHWPLHAPEETIAKYVGRYRDGWDALRERRRKRMIELLIIEASWGLSPRDPAVPAWIDAPNKEWEDRRMAVYAAQIDRMDRGIGRILDAIRSIGAERRTLIFFLSDNGGCAEVLAGNDPARMPGGNDTYMSYGIGWANASDTPFRLYKHWTEEGGISTPLIAYWPEEIPAGRIARDPGHVIDILPTCLDAAGVEFPASREGRPAIPPEGKSLLPILRGGSRAGHDALYWEHEGNRAVRQGRWKLVARHGGPWQLFDLQEDRAELRDLAPSQPERVRAMASLWEGWAKRVGVVPWESLKAPAKKNRGAPSAGRS